MDFIAMAETLEAQAALLRQYAATQVSADDVWFDWAGGDEPPENARGKVVEIAMRAGISTEGPAESYGWAHPHMDYTTKPLAGDIVRYRIAAEQPKA